MVVTLSLPLSLPLSFPLSPHNLSFTPKLPLFTASPLPSHRTMRVHLSVHNGPFCDP